MVIMTGDLRIPSPAPLPGPRGGCVCLRTEAEASLLGRRLEYLLQAVVT